MNLLSMFFSMCFTAFFISITLAARVSVEDSQIEKSKDNVKLLNGPVYTFVKTDKEANVKWGVRHYVPRKN